MRRACLLLAPLLVACSQVATPQQCDVVATHLAQLKVKKEQQPPFGKLTIAPFNGPAEIQAVHDEARAAYNARCAKGWKRAAVDCMMKSTALDAAEGCRGL